MTFCRAGIDISRLLRLAVRSALALVRTHVVLGATADDTQKSLSSSPEHGAEENPMGDVLDRLAKTLGVSIGDEERRIRSVAMSGGEAYSAVTSGTSKNSQRFASVIHASRILA